MNFIDLHFRCDTDKTHTKCESIAIWNIPLGVKLICGCVLSKLLHTIHLHRYFWYVATHSHSDSVRSHCPIMFVLIFQCFWLLQPAHYIMAATLVAYSKFLHHSAKTVFPMPLKANSFSANNTHKNYNQILSSVSRVNPQFLFRMLFLSLSYILNCYVYRVRCTLEQCKRRKIASDRIQICHWLVPTKFNRWRQSPNQANWIEFDFEFSLPDCLLNNVSSEMKRNE